MDNVGNLIVGQCGIRFGHLVYFVSSLYIFSVLVCCAKKNLATLLCSMPRGNSGRRRSLPLTGCRFSGRLLQKFGRPLLPRYQGDQIGQVFAY
jgi:hypothetical protein